jgi:hypothetical protein
VAPKHPTLRFTLNSSIRTYRTVLTRPKLQPTQKSTYSAVPRHAPSQFDNTTYVFLAGLLHLSFRTYLCRCCIFSPPYDLICTIFFLSHPLLYTSHHPCSCSLLSLIIPSVCRCFCHLPSRLRLSPRASLHPAIRFSSSCATTTYYLLNPTHYLFEFCITTIDLRRLVSAHDFMLTATTVNTRRS